MPQEYINDKVSRTAQLDTTCCPVSGDTPPLANVAAIIAKVSAFVSMEHS